MVDLREKSCCFTGPRPKNLPWGANEYNFYCRKIKRRLKKTIITQIKDGTSTFYCGMALGFDTICVEMILSLKKKYPFITIVGALPCRDQDKLWSSKDKERYRKNIEKLDAVYCNSDSYNGPQCMIERNHYMVNNSSVLIAYLGNSTGGTKTTIEYAKQKGLKIIMLDL